MMHATNLISVYQYDGTKFVQTKISAPNQADANPNFISVGSCDTFIELCPLLDGWGWTLRSDSTGRMPSLSVEHYASRELALLAALTDWLATGDSALLEAV